MLPDELGRDVPRPAAIFRGTIQGEIVGLSWAWVGIVAAGFPAVRSRVQTVSSAHCPGTGNDFQGSTKPRNCAEIEAKTVSGNSEIEAPASVAAEIEAAPAAPGLSSVSRRPALTPREAVDRFLLEWFETEPGAEVAFAEIHAFYSRRALRGNWPPISQVLLSRRLRALGARREQRRLSETDKPIFYAFPDEGQVECGPVKLAA